MTRISNPDPPTLWDLFRNNKKDTMSEMNCVQVGMIEAFDKNNQTASISILIKKVQDINPDGSRTVRELPVLLECPVMVLSGGASHLTMPIQKGDTCIVLFNDREYDNWFISGEKRAPTTPRKHDLSDGMAIVGIRSLQNALDDYLEDAVRLRYSTNSQIVLSNGAINSLAAEFTHTGNMTVTGNLQIDGNFNVDGQMTGSGDSINLQSDLIQDPSFVMEAGNGATGTFTTVTVVKGIVTSGS